MVSILHRDLYFAIPNAFLISINSRIEVLDLAEKVEETFERQAQVRLHQVTRHGTQPSGTGVPLQRLPTGSHRPPRRRLDRKRQEHFLQRRPVLPTDRPEPTNRDSRVGR